MTISYNWLCDYLPPAEADLTKRIEPAMLADILTSIGLEVESTEEYEEIKGGLIGLIVGEIMTCEKHPDADKLKITTVNTGEAKPLNIVCGASNVAVGQKVVVAPVGSRIYPITGEPLILKKAKIRGIESEGMICAEDEIGISANHDGIFILPDEIPVGTKLADVFLPYHDHIFEIGLTPNRIDAMSHLGVAKDVCAWLSHHKKIPATVLFPSIDKFKQGSQPQPIEVIIENSEACRRYSGVSIHGITVTDSPLWLRQKLKSIGLNPINNIVDITNFILQETGQPLHAFDADNIRGKKIVVKNAGENEAFKTLDGKERKLNSNDLMICNAVEPMCIAGVYGGFNSGVRNDTKNIFLESAWFDPSYIRKTSLRHNLRTDAATRFEKGTDISNTVNVLKRAALLICEIAGGEIVGGINDQYPSPLQKTNVVLKNSYLEKLSGKKYSPDVSINILKSLGFEINSKNTDEINIQVPFNKPDITMPADIVEEIMRIDGLDNIEIPGDIKISAAVEKNRDSYQLKEKIAGYLTGFGFYEIFTNSVTNSNFYSEAILSSSVKMINSLSADLDILRPDMIQGGLQAIAHNFNRKNSDLKFFEFGKTYFSTERNKYAETTHLSFYIAGHTNTSHWKVKAAKPDIYYLKGVIERLFQLCGISKIEFLPAKNINLENVAAIKTGNKTVGFLGEVNEMALKQFEIRQPVFYADINWDEVLAAKNVSVEYREISKFPSVTRDLAVVVDKSISYNKVEEIALARKIKELKSVRLFDVFESDKLGAGKKSMALSFVFLDESKTLVDKEIDIFMQKIISSYEESIGAEIRK